MSKSKYPVRKRAGWIHGGDGVYLNERSVYGMRSQCAWCGLISMGYNPHRHGACKSKPAAEVPEQQRAGQEG